MYLPGVFIAVLCAARRRMLFGTPTKGNHKSPSSLGSDVSCSIEQSRGPLK